MKHALTAAALAALLCACASADRQGSSQVYGEIKTGIETSHTSVK